MLAFPKPTPRRILKARNDRAEVAVKKSVRAKAVERDGYCRLAGIDGFGPCRGPSQWSHLFDRRRSQTRCQAPEIRHSTRASAMFCERHSALEEARRIR